uniref:Chitin-binding type-2 domain-containing protein n=2 Tax=Lutzomyia longipalpis TaxID=7200 RepID=A0A1B0CP11_LUTLO
LTRPSASLIARRAGATQYAEHLESSSEERRRHGISKRLVNSDTGEYEVYQGVLGRAGIDFPVLPGIPKTTFNCKSVGNGYFADLDTECQVFHICDDGRKISFLCPNGTIFRQTDLICDWWFKVNCAASPSQYAESAETLARSQNRRSSAPAKLQTLTETEVRNDTEPELPKSELQVTKLPSATRKSYKESRVRTGPTKLRSRQYSSFEYSSQQDGSNESYDFEDFIVPRRRPSYRTRVPVRLVSHPDFDHIYRINYRGPPLTFRVDPASKESQEFAESASFLKQRNTFNGYTYQQPDKRVKLNNGDTETTTSPAPMSTDTPNPTALPRRGTAVYSTINSIQDEIKYTTQAPIDSRKVNKYTTARRLESSRTTPYYTPTVPTVSSRSQFEPARQVSTVSPAPSSTTAASPVSLEENPIHVPEIETEREHAMEMMKTLKELEMVTSSPTAPTPAEAEKSNIGQRVGLQIPPSSGPDTLHSLALYFATAMDNIARNSTTERSVSTTDGITASLEAATEAKGIVGALLRNETVSNYEKLFQPQSAEATTLPATTEVPETTTPDLLSRIASIPLTDNNDLEGQHSKNPIISAAGTQQIRELAQVFTHALSAYLHDPIMFRKVLSEIRPTEPPPPPPETNEVVSSRFGRTEDFAKRDNQISTQGVTYLPTTPSTTTTTEDLEVLDFSDVTISTKRDITNEPLTPASVTATPSKEKSSTFDLVKTPGSDLISENLERSASKYYNNKNNDEDNEIPTTTENQLAAEINGELTISTIFPYLSGDSRENEGNFSLDENSYFPMDSGEVKRNVSSSKPYGFDVIGQLRVENLVTSTAAPVPANRWGSDVTTDAPYSTVIPVSLSSDLTPPEKKEKSTTNANKPSILILPPPKLEDEENLQRAQSQSLVASGNQILADRKGKAFPSSTEVPVSTTVAFESTTPEPRFDFSHTSGESLSTTFAPLSQVKGHYITKALPETTTVSSPEAPTTTDFPDVGKFSPNPWSTLAYTIFLDPLTINDGLMNSGEEESTSGNAKLINGLPRTTVPYTGELTTEATSTKFGLRNSFDDDQQQKPQNVTTNVKDAMKRRANEMFGGLNETSVNHLMNVMKKADSNKTVRRLILLLIQTCDEDYTKTVEESRKALLDALIGMDRNDIEDNIQILNTNQLRGRGSRKIRLQTANGHNVIVDSSTSSVPITTYRRVVTAEAPSTTSTTQPPPTTTTEAAETTTLLPETTTTLPRLRELSGRFQADEAISAETLSTFDDFGRRTTPLQSYTSTTQPPEEPTTIFPIYYHSSETTTQPPPAETVPPSTTTTTTTTTTSRPRPPRIHISNDEATKRVGKSLEMLLGHHPGNTVQQKRSDERALELLKSLYALAAKWGRR